MSARNFGLTEGEIQELKKRPYPRFAPAPMQRLISQAKVIWPFAVGWAVTLFLYSRIPITDDDRAKSHYQYQLDVLDGKIKPEDHPIHGHHGH